MCTIFHKYTEGNELDKLIDFFIKDMKIFLDIESYSKFHIHKWHWPDIVLTDSKAILKLPKELENENKEFTIELLGSYTPNNDNPKEGFVTLYVNTIYNAAEAYKKYQENTGSSTLEINSIVNNLSTIILIHEFVHWIMDLFRLSIGNEIESITTSHPHKYVNKDSIYFHESIAQIITNYYCYQNNDLKAVFLWLEKKQPKQYWIYKSLFDVEKVSDAELKDIEFQVTDVHLKNIIYATCLLRVNKLHDCNFQSFLRLYNLYTNNSFKSQLPVGDYLHIFENWNPGNLVFPEHFATEYSSYICKTEILNAIQKIETRLVSKKLGL